MEFDTYTSISDNNYIVENKIKDIKTLLLALKDKYSDYAFISYIDGEYGMRAGFNINMLYFYKKCKEKD